MPLMVELDVGGGMLLSRTTLDAAEQVARCAPAHACWRW